MHRVNWSVSVCKVCDDAADDAGHHRARGTREFRPTSTGSVPGWNRSAVTFQIHDGLAVYQVGAGAPVLVLPYPHAGTLRPMGEDRLPQLLAGLGRKAITFDPPGAYRSTRPMNCEMAEMLDSAAESLAVAGANPPVDVVGQSSRGVGSPDPLSHHRTCGPASGGSSG